MVDAASQHCEARSHAAARLPLSADVSDAVPAACRGLKRRRDSMGCQLIRCGCMAAPSISAMSTKRVISSCTCASARQSGAQTAAKGSSGLLLLLLGRWLRWLEGYLGSSRKVDAWFAHRDVQPADGCVAVFERVEDVLLVLHQPCLLLASRLLPCSPLGVLGDKFQLAFDHVDNLLDLAQANFLLKLADALTLLDRVEQEAAELLDVLPVRDLRRQHLHCA
mmetsp:Transcript_14179/g.36721  ORF Transcript_14179/g.36721 Transcript_14179/m.36721 type:complete len:222 (+) Transcript_14179:170-835(+)